MAEDNLADWCGFTSWLKPYLDHEAYIVQMNDNAPNECFVKKVLVVTANMPPLLG